MTIGLIINPKARTYKTSSRVRQSLEHISPHTQTAMLENFSTLPDIIRQFAKTNCTHIMTSGGDGTVQAILTVLAEQKAFAELPTMILLPHGTTNMTAKDVSIKNLKHADKLFAHIQGGNDLSQIGEMTQRHTIKIENPKNNVPVHGMYFGWGAVHRAVLKCQGDVHAMGFTGDLGPVLTLLGSWVSNLFGGGGNAPDRIVQGADLTLKADGKTRCTGEQLLLSVTTLEYLIANCRPFWNQSQDALKTTIITHPVPKPIRMLAPVLYGDKSRQITEPGYDSFSASTLEFDTMTDCILDGEIVEPPMDAPLRLSLGPKFKFLKV